MEDYFVKLLDGSQVLKSKVPDQAIYIDKDGKKHRRVYVQKTVAHQPKPQPKPAGLWGSISSFVSKTTEDVGCAVSSVAQSVNAGYTAAANAFEDVANRKMSEWLSVIDFDATIQALEKYQKESGKDVSILTNFVKQLKGVKI